MPKLALLRALAGGLMVPAVAILLFQTVASRAFTIEEKQLSIPPLDAVPMRFSNWTAPQEQSLEQNVTDYLKPDRYILRDYRNDAENSNINLFVAYFKSLKNVYGPHSPRVCLPGSGWLIRSSAIKTIAVPGRPDGIPVNEYVLDKDGNQILVLYWYQNNRNVWAEEYQEKLRLLGDMVRYRRSDVSLVRVITQVTGRSVTKETDQAVSFSQELFPQLAALFEAAK